MVFNKFNKSWFKINEPPTKLTVGSSLSVSTTNSLTLSKEGFLITSEVIITLPFSSLTLTYGVKIPVAFMNSPTVNV